MSRLDRCTHGAILASKRFLRYSTPFRVELTRFTLDFTQQRLKLC
jgi:hypothetical protein